MYAPSPLSATLIDQNAGLPAWPMDGKETGFRKPQLGRKYNTTIVTDTTLTFMLDWVSLGKVLGRWLVSTFLTIFVALL